MATITLTGDITEADNHLSKVLGAVPALVREYELLLHNAFETTQSDVHVITGSLRGSGKVSSDVEENTWIGAITYGGDSPGFPHDPVTYADTERARGGDHDFFANVHLFGEQLNETTIHLLGW